MTDINIGDVFNKKYVIKKDLGSGAHKKVFLAHDEYMKRDVVLKIFCQPEKPELAGRIDADKDESFLAEASTLAALAKEMEHTSSRYVSRIYEAHKDDNTKNWFITEELVQGVTLEKVLEQKKQLPVENLVWQLSNGLLFLHQAGYAHNDLSMRNVIVHFPNGKPGSLESKIIDLGSARQPNDAQSEGSFEIRAPEKIFKGKVIPDKADMWSLGCILYYAATGQKIQYKGMKDEELREALTKGIPPPADKNAKLSRFYNNFIMSLLHIDPTKRISSKQAVSKLYWHRKRNHVRAGVASAIAAGLLAAAWHVNKTDEHMLMLTQNNQGSQTLYSLDYWGILPRALASNVVCAAASPDGTRIAYSRMQGNSATIEIIGRNDSSVNTVFNEELKIPELLVWSHDSSRLCFALNEFSSLRSICTVDADGTNLTTVVQNVTANSISLMPNGWVVYENRERIYATPQTGGDAIQLMDGNVIATLNNGNVLIGGRKGIHLWRVAENNPSNALITEPTIVRLFERPVSELSTNREGTRAAFISEGDVYDMDIATVIATGIGRRLTNTPVAERNPFFFRDRTWYLPHAGKMFENVTWLGSLCPPTAQVREQTQNPESITPNSESQQSNSPQISMQNVRALYLNRSSLVLSDMVNNEIACTEVDSFTYFGESAFFQKQGDIMRIDLRTRDITNLTCSRAFEGSPVVSGDYVFFASDAGGCLNIYRTALDGSCIQQLTQGHTEKYWPSVSSDGMLLAYAWDDNVKQGFEVLNLQTRQVVARAAVENIAREVRFLAGNQYLVIRDNLLPSIIFSNEGMQVRTLENFLSSPGVAPSMQEIIYQTDDCTVHREMWNGREYTQGGTFRIPNRTLSEWQWKGNEVYAVSRPRTHVIGEQESTELVRLSQNGITTISVLPDDARQVMLIGENP